MDLDALTQDVWSPEEVAQLSADEQFRWICSWLSEKKLFGTLDNLMSEYDLESASLRKLVRIFFRNILIMVGGETR